MTQQFRDAMIAAGHRHYVVSFESDGAWIGDLCVWASDEIDLAGKIGASSFPSRLGLDCRVTMRDDTL